MESASPPEKSGKGGLIPLPNSPVKLAFGMFWLFAGVGALMPFLPLYFDSLGISADGIALLLAVPAITSLVFMQFWGYLADLYFRRTKLLLLMSLGAAVMLSIFPYIPGEVHWLALGCFGTWMFLSPRPQTMNAIALASERGEERYGPVRLAGSISFAITAVTLGIMVDNPNLGIAFMWPVLVFIEVMLAISMGLLKDFAPEHRSRTTVVPEKKISFFKAQGKILDNSLMRWFLIFTLSAQMFHFPGLMLQVKLLKDLQASALFIMSCMALAAIAEISIFLFSRWLLRKIRLMPMLGLAAIAIVIRWGLVWGGQYFSPILAPDDPDTVYRWTILVASVFHLFTFGMAYFAATIFVNRESPEDLRSSAQTLYGIFFGAMAMFIGNLVAWQLLKHVDLPGYFGISALGAALSLLLWLPLKNSYEKKYHVKGFWIK